MKINTAIAYFGTPAALARALRITQPAIGNWLRRNGELMPELYARRLHDMTGGKLKFDHAVYGLSPPVRSSRSRGGSGHAPGRGGVRRRTVALNA